jgi:hypothetical protein
MHVSMHVRSSFRMRLHLVQKLSGGTGFPGRLRSAAVFRILGLGRPVLRRGSTRGTQSKRRALTGLPYATAARWHILRFFARSLVTSPHNAGGPHGSKRGSKHERFGLQGGRTSWPIQLFRGKVARPMMLQRTSRSYQLTDLYSLPRCTL